MLYNDSAGALSGDYSRVDGVFESMEMRNRMKREKPEDFFENLRKTMAEHPDLRRRLSVPRSVVPAITHVDYSARLQSVDRDRNPRFHGLLQAFHELTGCPILVNTSFNIRGEPIVYTPEDAWRCFQATDIDVLVLEDCVIQKRELAGSLDQAARAHYRAQFQPD